MGPALPAEPTKIALGPKSLRAITQPIVYRRRQTQLTPLDYTGVGVDNIMPIPDPTVSWRTLEVQRKHLLNLPYTRLSDLALDLSPQINKGLWDFVRFGNPGKIIEEDNPRAEESNKDFLRRVGNYYGNFKNHVDSMWACIFVYGSVFTELVLDIGAGRAIDIAVNDPLSARFRVTTHPVRGQIREFGQQQRHGFLSLEDNPLTTYIGFNRIGNNPYGRPLIAPSVHASLFLLGLVSDLRRMIANQGLSRIDYSLEAEELLKLIDRNPDIQGDDEATAQFITEQIELIKETVNNLEVDDDYVHLSTVQVNHATNSIQTNLQGVDSLITNLQRDVINGMNSVSILSNLLDSTTETHGTLQLEYYVSALRSLQEEFDEMLSGYLNINNQVQGIPSESVYKSLRQRTRDKREVAETRKIEVDTIINKLDAGIINESEARGEVEMLTDELEVTV